MDLEQRSDKPEGGNRRREGGREKEKERENGGERETARETAPRYTHARETDREGIKD